jgi:hypothetical protein
MIKHSSRIWRLLADFWTILAFAVIIEDFRRVGALDNLLGPVLAIYIAILAIFSAEKEFERWQWYNKGRHRGEVYVVLWTVLMVGILGAIYLSNNGYEMDPEIYSTYIVVLGILAITRKSKQVFAELERRR